MVLGGSSTVSYLDLPELAMLARMSHLLALLSSDPILHFKRLWVVSPSRVNHHLFGTSPNGRLLRPTVGDLVQRGIMRGLGLERRWRRGLYLYSLDVSVIIVVVVVELSTERCFSLPCNMRKV